MKTSSKKTIFSGIKPSGNLHLGNYLGAIKQWVAMQENNNCIFCVVDYHAITVEQNPKELAERTLEIAKIYLAAGIDPKKSIIFRQSDIKEHTELAWILNCTTARMSDLENMTQYKDKAKISSEDENRFKKTVELSFDEKNSNRIYNATEEEKLKNEETERILSVAAYDKRRNVSVGLFDYPVLMAADILLYDTDVVPVGEDQVQHVELTRDLAKRFNNKFGETFRIPKAETLKEGARIMGLENPLKKMSKSEGGDANCIYLLDDPEKAAKKIMRATTDSGSGIKFDKENKPGVSNLLNIYSLLTARKISDIEAEFANSGYGEFKVKLAELVKSFLTEFQKRYYNINTNAVKKILRKGGDKLRKISLKKIKGVKNKVGIL
jgi:tryptophanyl-tRNA synthetase